MSGQLNTTLDDFGGDLWQLPIDGLGGCILRPLDILDASEHINLVVVKTFMLF